MENCDHVNLEKTVVTKNFLTHTFTSNGRKCTDCGATLWDNNLNAEFHSWLKDLDLENQKQFMISKDTEHLLQEFMRQNFCKDESSTIRAIISVVNNSMSDPVRNKIFSDVLATEDFRNLESAPTTVSKKVRINNPKGLYDFEVWKEILQMNDSEFIRTSVLLMLTIGKQVNNQFYKFWNEHFKDLFEVVLAA